jgi:hypothetical protein
VPEHSSIHPSENARHSARRGIALRIVHEEKLRANSVTFDGIAGRIDP